VVRKTVVGGAQPVQAAGQHEVLAAGRLLVRSAELADVADPPPDPPRCAPDVLPGDVGVAGVGRQQRGEDAQGRGLARAVGPEQAEDLPGGDGQVDAADGLNRGARGPERLAQPGHLDRRHRW
jgi:hypothetical protein